MHVLCYVSAGEVAIGYMTYYVTVNGDPSPEGNRILLPLGITTKSIYDKYLESNRDSAVKESHFYRLWRDKFSHVSQQKVGLSFIFFIKPAKIITEEQHMVSCSEIIALNFSLRNSMFAMFQS